MKRKLRLDAGQIEVIDDDCARIYASKSPAERLKIASGMWRSAQKLLKAAIKSQHPHWSEQEVRGELIRRLSHGAL
ncbi:MAG TPA: hypothetical protein VK186_00120 [Candidatus Deferrimicrobium sp.]|nr:hypothetical protein [Candidatus Kapabacteria bacterium]HLP57195.1 hypothetical protein [Candidatus Deferrimicrobium sp.]